MPRYASGVHALGISDRSGRAYPLRVMLKEWNGSLVGPDEYESKQPQIEPKRVIADPRNQDMVAVQVTQSGLDRLWRLTDLLGVF